MNRAVSSSDQKAVGDNCLRSNASPLGHIDAAILRELSSDARISRAELARRVGLSALSIGDRNRRLEDTGVIAGYSVQIDASKLGDGLTIVIRARPLPGEMQNMIEAIKDTPQIVSCERISGDDCFIARAHERNYAVLNNKVDFSDFDNIGWTLP
jgi:Lrp/AsnC family transcriptional regulator, leucine-responsive regulatory protein